MTTLVAILKAWTKLLLGRGSVRSFSQFGEDAIAATFFRSKRSGVYVDVGAYHPTLYSNTYLFYRKGWSGVVVDPNRSLAPVFQAVRPRDRFVTAGVGDQGTLRYYEYEDGAYNSFDAEQVREQKERKHLAPVREYDVAIQPLAKILEDAKVTHIDLLSVDVEGMDTAVLATHNWSIRPKVIIAEDRDFSVERPHDSEVYRLLTEKGYALRSVARLSLIFVDTQ